jgi:gas vesicle protein
MKRRQGGDASFLIGIILGIVVGAAIAVILAEATQGDNLSLNNEVERAKDSLESTSNNNKARISGASEGLAPE